MTPQPKAASPKSFLDTSVVHKIQLGTSQIQEYLRSAIPQKWYMRIPTKAITNSDLSRSAIRRHADHARSEATLADEILTEVIGIRQRMR